MRRVSRATLAAILSCGFATATANNVLAQNQKLDPKFVGYLNSPGYQKQLVQFFSEAEPLVRFEKCDSIVLKKARLVEIVQRPTFANAANGGLNIDGGAWVVAGTMVRCGAKVRRRLFLRATKGKNELRYAPLLPGQFAGNLKLEIDARRIVGAGLMGNAGCKDSKKFKVIDVVSLTPASNKGWSEKWIAKACGKRAECTVKYSATASGMNISASQCSAK